MDVSPAFSPIRNLITPFIQEIFPKLQQKRDGTKRKKMKKKKINWFIMCMDKYESNQEETIKKGWNN